MLNDNIISKYRYDAQGLAEYYLGVHFENQTIKFPINPFQILTDLGIHFVFRNFEKLEGLFMPSMTEQDVDLVIINAKRPITRQRFTAAHELSHYLKDARIANSFICNSDGQKSYIEAKRMLHFTEKPLCDISNALCFSSQSHFQSVFRTVTGMTPVQYRKTAV